MTLSIGRAVYIGSRSRYLNRAHQVEHFCPRNTARIVMNPARMCTVLVKQGSNSVAARTGLVSWRSRQPAALSARLLPVLMFCGLLAFVTDIKHRDVRSEGLSYGMIIAVQLGKKAEFDAVWNWSKTYLYARSGTHAFQKHSVRLFTGRLICLMACERAAGDNLSLDYPATVGSNQAAMNRSQ